MKIERTARGKPKDLGSNSNVELKAREIKRTDVLEPYVPEGKKAEVGREIWQVEFDGLGAVEVKLDIPPSVNRIKDADKRTEKVKALALKAALEQGDGMLKDHVG